MQTAVDLIYDGEVFRPDRPLRIAPNTHVAILIDEPPVGDPEADAICDAAWRIYDERLKATLEPDHVGKVVAIHPDSGDYEVAQSSPRAWKALRARQVAGMVVVINIGSLHLSYPLIHFNASIFHRIA